MNFYSCKCCGKIYSKPLLKCEYCDSSLCYSCSKENENICLNCLTKNN